MSSNPQPVDSVTIVGGGDAGLLTALALERGLSETEIVVVDDFEAAVPEVGKSTLTALVRVLHQSLGIDQTRLLDEVKFAWKTSVYFKDWCGDSFHSPLGASIPVVNSVTEHSTSEPRATRSQNLTHDNEAAFQEFYYRYNEGEFATIYGELAEHPGKSPLVISPQNPRAVEMGLGEVAYHFDSNSLNEFLRTLCRERGVQLVDDRITDVETDGDRIEGVASETAEYTADLYVDASGFKRLLMGELSGGFVAFDLPVDSAVATTTDLDLSEVVSATVVTSGTAGWFWQIDTIDTRDIGYVYSSEHLSDEAAKQELIDARDEQLSTDAVRQYRFESGVLERPWINNCVAAGNALGFVEPLQSTALTTSALLSERLARLLGKHGGIAHDGVRELYNDSVRETWEEIHKFISLYYRFNSGSTAFWEDARSIDVGEIPQYDAYDASGFAAPGERLSLTQTDTGLNGWYLYHLVLRQLGCESAFFEQLDLEIDDHVVDTVDSYTAALPEKAEEFLSYAEFYSSFHSG